MYDWIGRITTHPARLNRFRRILGIVPAFAWLPLLAGLSRLAHRAAGAWRERIKKNMEAVLPYMPEKQRDRHIRHYFFHLFLSLYEIVLKSRRLDPSSAHLFTVRGEEYLEEALREGRGAILYTPHQGNFFYYYWALSRKYDCLTVATGGSPELRPLYLLFQDLGCRGLDYDNTPPVELYKTLRRHLENNGVLFLLGDFWRPNFPETMLFGRKTRLPAGAAVLALEQQAPVIPFHGYRTRGWRHELVFGEPIYLHREYERRKRDEALNRLAEEMEKMILSRPEQWFYWFNVHERWEMN